MIAEGRDPLEDRRAAPTFREIAAEFLDRTLDSFRNPTHRDQWRATLKTYALPVIGERPIKSLTPNDIAEVLEPLWLTRSETAQRLRGRMERIMDAAKAGGHFVGDNPAALAVLRNLLPLPPRGRSPQHHKAMHYRDLPAFITELRQRDPVSARALLWTILTAARRGRL
jgi:integrase